MSEEKQLFVGIDLGTTNSVISYGTLNPRTNQIEPRVIELQMQDAQNGQSRRPLLPSCVYFREGSIPIVGEYAKAMAGRQSHRVIRSIKSQMGQANEAVFEDKSYRPEDVSALILSFLAKAAEKTLGFQPRKVVITVPASFDSDMRQATLLAAERAGFDVRESDGRWKEILLDEPRAALYDFINRQSRGDIPDSLIDFRTPQHVMVFDLGGGTLDVSLHRVLISGESDELKMEDIAISRYTRLGGDDFDRVLAEHLQNRFLQQLGQTKILSDFERNELTAKFLAIAEEAKLELSNEAENRRSLGHSLEDLEIEIIKGHVWDDRAFEYTLRADEYEKLVSGLLGEAWNLKDAEHLDSLPEEATRSIVYPILDVLRKAEERLGEKLQVNVVLLNGGMTKSFVIQDRLTRLFGIRPISAGDPDKAVARGAVVHHYNMHRGLKIAKILNDSIGIGLDGGFVKHLVPAGTVLPHTSAVLNDFVVPVDGATYIDLPFYTGRRKDTQAPNRRLANRRVRFPKPLTEGTDMSFQVTLDASGAMEVKGWLTSSPETTFSVQVATDAPESQSPPSAMTGRSESTAAPALQRKVPHVPVPTGPVENVIGVRGMLGQQLGKCKDRIFSQNSGLRQEIRSLEERILCAANREKFIPALLELADEVQTADGLARLLLLLGQLAERTEDIPLRDQVCLKCMELTDIRIIPMKTDYYHQTVTRGAVEAIGKTSSRLGESHLVNLLARPPVTSLRASLLHSLGKVAQSRNAAEHARDYLQDSVNGTRIAALWALGRMGSRERKAPLPMAALSPAFTDLLRLLVSERHPDAFRNGLYALAEIGDRRGGGETISDALADSAIAWIAGFPQGTALQISDSHHQALWRFAQTVRRMIEGAGLTEDEQLQLLTIRTQLGAGVSELTETAT